MATSDPTMLSLTYREAELLNTTKRGFVKIFPAGLPVVLQRRGKSLDRTMFNNIIDYCARKMLKQLQSCLPNFCNPDSVFEDKGQALTEMLLE